MKKKHFGQHFLKHQKDAETIGVAVQGWGVHYQNLLEIGPGEGMLTQFLADRAGDEKKLKLI